MNNEEEPSQIIQPADQAPGENLGQSQHESEGSSNQSSNLIGSEETNSSDKTLEEKQAQRQQEIDSALQEY